MTGKTRKCFFGLKVDRQLDGDKMNRTFVDRVMTEGGEGVAIAACMQCGTCSGGCTNIDRMDLSPRTLVLMVQRGEWDKVLQSQSLWLCTSCYICTSRCPRGVRPSDVIEAVKAIAIRQGIENDSTRFNQIFVELIQKRGILFEPELMQKYGGISAMLEQAELGIKLALKGKMSPFPAKIQDPTTFSQALEKAAQS
ncbi:4Fe-4S dicluster domain-containing protein [Desertifilum sp. FACHB-1129]|uniref:Heterodisulfide reductase n=2 Tax=Desertifilum tharense IPPAS B-1220 TaxID=1781255 RepID=A0A1E5QCY1_9CYAN|nr:MULTISPECIES: 4Fe-4S dicluster domain-containing protein [Desertifilum]MDA0209493.1 4Fe-4S dicluster domain-containing protein [Cyanobacteria bacterium FC1]MBD2314081.1 4Fe-4S dicluster domain-containing protein [Desertifilum sp. FACHB-1129]MBD2321047.1 4Fe-4S dicluster domain-containing protein [Desertifilum sp. FACHB-866]MBD2331176.1 4Fe-4S dicluster domain-containing protein [Desertifilum sp. FACHB-868]OEJ72516.1 heterodisulfide reductase [Desertifilum tharense IPPAS B-1220]